MTDDKNNTLCWKCKRSCGANQCNWANFLEPIDGWKTIQGDNKDEKTRTADVIFCPEFIRDEKAIGRNDVYRLIADYLGVEPVTVQPRWEKYALKYQKQIALEYGGEAFIPEDKRIPTWFWYKEIDRGI